MQLYCAVVCYVLYPLLLLVFVDHFHPSCLAPEAPCQQGLRGWPGVTWWWPQHHLAPTSCHQVLFSLFEFGQQSLYTEVPRVVIPGIFLRSDFSAPSHQPRFLLWFFMCVCISTTEACSIVSLRSMEPSSPADLFKTAQSSQLSPVDLHCVWLFEQLRWAHVW